MHFHSKKSTAAVYTEDVVHHHGWYLIESVKWYNFSTESSSIVVDSNYILFGTLLKWIKFIWKIECYCLRNKSDHKMFFFFPMSLLKKNCIVKLAIWLERTIKLDCMHSHIGYVFGIVWSLWKKAPVQMASRIKIESNTYFSFFLYFLLFPTVNQNKFVNIPCDVYVVCSVHVSSSFRFYF